MVRRNTNRSHPSKQKAALEAEGVSLARTRRVKLKELIQTSPQQALAMAIPWEIRQKLPAPVVAQLERPISGRGDFRCPCRFRFRDRPRHCPAPDLTHGETF